MRTTLSIDDDVLLAVKERAAREKRSVGEVLSELACSALNGVGGDRAAGDAPSRHGFRPLPRRGGQVSNALVDQLRDEEGVSRALLDAEHVDHDRAWAWADVELARGRASCAITENGFVRILSQPQYASPLSPHQAVLLLRETCERSDHEFWSCDLSLLDDTIVDSARLHGHRQLTHAYLLALASVRGARFVTFDRSIATSAVPRARKDDLVVL